MFGENDFFASYSISTAFPISYTFSGDFAIELLNVTGRDMTEIEGLAQDPRRRSRWGG